MSAQNVDARKPIPRDERGWRVAPAPDGRGTPDLPPMPPRHRSRGLLGFVPLLLALNRGSLLLLHLAGQPRMRVRLGPTS
jgi:hypothetical protein